MLFRSGEKREVGREGGRKEGENKGGRRKRLNNGAPFQRTDNPPQFSLLHYSLLTPVSIVRPSYFSSVDSYEQSSSANDPHLTTQSNKRKTDRDKKLSGSFWV